MRAGGQTLRIEEARVDIGRLKEREIDETAQAQSIPSLALRLADLPRLG